MESRKEQQKRFREMGMDDVDENGRFKPLTQEHYAALMNAPLTPEREASMKEFEQELKNFTPPPQPVDYKMAVICDRVMDDEEAEHEFRESIGMYSDHANTVIRNDMGQVVKEIFRKKD